MVLNEKHFSTIFQLCGGGHMLLVGVTTEHQAGVAQAAWDMF